MRLPTVLAPLLAVTASMAALAPLNPPVPLASPEPAASPGEGAFDLLSAQRSEDLGFPSTAIALYRSMLAAPGADTGRLTIALSSALLDDGDVPGAARVLESYPGPRGSAWHLRAGLIAAYNQRTEQARAELAASHFDELEAADRGWHLFLQGMLADAAHFEKCPLENRGSRSGRAASSSRPPAPRCPTSSAPGSSSPRSRSGCG